LESNDLTIKGDGTLQIADFELQFTEYGAWMYGVRHAAFLRRK
jgi:hypothetical protein